MKNLTILLLLIILSGHTQAQSLAINTDGTTANNSAMLDIKSTTKGLLMPRLTKAQKNAITTPAAGLLIYQTSPDSIGFYYYQNSRWNWLTDNHKSDTSYWGLHGNNNTTPPSSNNNTPIDFATDTYLGTFQPEDVSFVAGGNEMLRLKQVSGGGRIGMQNRNPEYGLDIRLTESFPPASALLGIRMIPNSLFDMSNPVNTDKGLVLGTSANNPKETVLWNHGNNIDAAIRIGLDMFSSSIRPAVNITQSGLGIYQRSPKYALDIHARSQFTDAIPTTNKNGMRITYHNQEDLNQEQRGLFTGVDRNNSFKSYIWNYADGMGGNSPNKAIYFGAGRDMDLGGNATMELQDGKIIMGHISDPGFVFPGTLNIQTDYVSNVAKNGISVMKYNNTQESFYLGTDNSDNANLYKYGGGIILLGNPVDIPVSISQNNFVGIKTLTPNAPLQFDDIYENNKLVLHNNFHGNLPYNFHDFYGFGVNANALRYQVPNNNAAHIFYAGISNTMSNELMRITGNGYVGIGFNNPTAPLEFNSGQENRKIVLAGFGTNNDHNFFGFGRTNGELRYQVSINTDDHVFYKGDASGFSSTELFRVRGDGNTGIGATIPSAYGHTGNNKILELRNTGGGSNIQSQLVLSSDGTSGSLGGITWAGTTLSGEQRTGFIGNMYETTDQTRLSFYTRSNAGTLAERFYIQGNGNAWLQGTLTQASDARFKKDIQPLSSTLYKLNKISGYTYNWINEQRDTEEQIGLLAQEVQKVYPQLVRQNEKGELSVNYTGLVPVLLEAVKSLNEKLEQQQIQINALKNK